MKTSVQKHQMALLIYFMSIAPIKQISHSSRKTPKQSNAIAKQNAKALICHRKHLHLYIWDETATVFYLHASQTSRVGNSSPTKY